MSNKNQYQKYYLGGCVIAVVFAGYLAAQVGHNVHDVPKNSSPSTTQPAAPGNPAPPTLNQVRDELPAQIAARMQQEAGAPIARIYEQFGYTPLWTKPSRLKDLTQVSALAHTQGIDTSDLEHLLRGAAQANAAANDIALTREALRLSEALRLGVVAREKLGNSWFMPSDSFDAVAGLSAALKDNDLQTYFNGLAPPDAQYKSLIAAFQTYRDLADQGGWPAIPGTDELKMSDARTLLLRDRLMAEGYLGRNIAVDAVQLGEAVKAFQARNGLEPDGLLGKGTLAALNVGADERVAQIAANLERWRHTPRDRGDKFVAVNSASTTLEFITKGQSILSLKVVTGDKRHGTPILFAKITGVTLNPRWEIPYSIATKEILPKLKKNPNYLADNNMVVVGGPVADPHGQSVDWSQYSTKSLPMRFRQNAGDDNALGLIKFQMSNPQNIYLHDTPSRSVFARNERHLSHGCVRVDQPASLAEHVLLETPGWDQAAITDEIKKGQTRTIALKTPLSVYIFYWTAFASDGAVNFRDDIYRRDMPLAEALGYKSSAAPAAKQNFAQN